MSERNSPQGARRDEIGALLRLAGKRPQVPDDRADRVRGAIEARWRDQTRQRRRRRAAAWAAGGLAAAAALLALLLPSWRVESPGHPLLVSVAIGDVRGGKTDPLSGSLRDLTTGSVLGAGDRLVTGSESLAALSIEGGGSLRVDGDTRLTVVTPERVRLDGGGLYVDSGHDGVGSGSLEVETAFGVVREIGTQYEVRLTPDRLLVRLREGAAVVEREERQHRVEAGSQLEIGASGVPIWGKALPHGEAWEWQTPLVTTPELSGRTAREFLEWVARERGWRLEFESADLERSATGTRLGGVPGRLRLENALDAILPTCRMTHVVIDGVLRVESAP